MRIVSVRTSSRRISPSSSSSIVASRDEENRTEYLGKGLEGAPFEILRYTDFGKDEKVSTIFEVLADVEAIPEIPLGMDRLLLQVIQGYADGQLSLFIVNGIPVDRPSTRPRDC